VQASAASGAVLLAIVVTMAAACGSPTPTSPNDAGTHTVLATVMLEASGPTPREIEVKVGETVSFMNHEGVPLTVAGGIGTSQSTCPEIDAAGTVAPGEIRPSLPFSTAKTCDYRVSRGQAVLYNGRIVVR
jgi:hypothetical protein